MIRSVLVVGGGSAGLLAALVLKKKHPDLNVTVVRSKEIGVIGVGESTTLAIPRMLHGYLDLDCREFYERVMPAWKLGIRFLQWGPREFFDYTFSQQVDWKWRELGRCNGYFCDDDFTYVSLSSALMMYNKVFVRQPNGLPYIDKNFGYHIENQRFVGYLEVMAPQRGITVIDDVVTGATCDDNGITAVMLASGRSMSADLYIDCSGFRSLLIGETLREPYVSFKSTLFCDRAVVGTWARTDEPVQPYTTAEAMSAGWCWRIDHPDCIMRGYVYSSDFIDDAAAEQEFRAKNPKITSTRIVRFSSGRYERTWVKNVVAVGNAGGFVEPLESTALAIICDATRILADGLAECGREPPPAYVRYYNRVVADIWDTIRDFLGIHYKFNTRYGTPFWRAARADTVLGPIQELVDFYKENGPTTFFRVSLLRPGDIFGMEGYLSLLVGQKVPYKARYAPSAEEKRLWDSVRSRNRAAAESGVDIPEGLRAVSLPNCRWQPGFFEVPEGARLTSYVATAV
jgi:tryptophan halogenase